MPLNLENQKAASGGGRSSSSSVAYALPSKDAGRQLWSQCDTWGASGTAVRDRSVRSPELPLLDGLNCAIYIPL
jgi:hypothetical protein